MKKLLFALCAVALLGLVSACVEPVNNHVPNPNYDPVKDRVTTQFYLNIAPASDEMRTKQVDTSVQVGGTFRGLGNATLFTIVAPDGDGHKVRRVVKGSQEGDTLYANSSIRMSDALKPGAIGVPGNESRRVVEISIPRETNTLLFYGEAITGESDDELNAFGGLEYTTDGNNLLAIGCNARRRLHPDSTNTVADFFLMEQLILDVANTLFQVGINNTQDTAKWENLSGKHAGTIGSYDLAGKQLHWSDFKNCTRSTDTTVLPSLLKGEHTTKVISPLEQALGMTYNAFVTLNEVDTVIGGQTKKIKELRSGSGMSIVRQVRDIHSLVTASLDSAPMSDEEAIAEIILQEIDEFIHLFFEIDANRNVTGWKNLYTTTITQGGTTTTINGVVDNLINYGIDPNATLPHNSIYTLNAFPFHFNIPLGSVTLINDNSAPGKIFKYQTQNISLSEMGGGTMSIYDYTYPSSLVYFGNSPIRVSKNPAVDRSSFPDGVNTWESAAPWIGYSGGDSLWHSPGHVEADTRAVAMINNIHYGSALLKTTVHFSDKAVSDGLSDNNHVINGDPNKILKIGQGDTTTLTLTGILIGGQPSHVGWNYIPVAPKGGSLSFNRMVYDKKLNGATGVQDGTTGIFSYPVDLPMDGAATTPNYTTVMDNYDPDKANNQSDVYIALELVNNLGEDFWGNANMVREGGTFYLMGKLHITSDQRASAQTDIWDKASVIMPPYWESDGEEGGVAHKAGDTKKHLRVFMQSFITTANITIGKDALKSAYVTVPDLRSATLSFGLSVDLNWKMGLSFDVPIGTDNE
ncbi:MAG: hypothetical protein IKS47_01880 [Bacteroidales bacterium]|nr:hypothetical protein [Bacteroidales bacterium]